MSLNKFTIQKSFAISAGAGSGKTYTLSRRYINAVLGFDFFREKSEQPNYIVDLKAATVDEIVTMTYTEAAALEMKERIFALMVKVLKFESLSNDDGDRSSIEEGFSPLDEKQKFYVKETLQTALESSGDARISTIHAYCLNVLKKYADVAKLDSRIDMIKDDEKANLSSEIIFSVLNAEENAPIVLELSKSINIFLFEGLIKKYINESKFRANLESFTKSSIDQELYKSLIRELYPLPGIESVEEELDEVRAGWLNDFVECFEAFEAVKWTDVHEEKAPSLGVTKYPTLDALKKQYETYLPMYAPVEQDMETHFFELVEKVKILLRKIKTAYDNELKAMKKLDFDTIITATLPIVQQIPSSIKYFMVDEFQDTNEIQYNIVKASCSDTTNLFVVGDSKQSIYSFQGAEIEVFNGAVSDTSRFDSCEQMSENHRSDGVVLDNVNAIFEKLLRADDSLALIKQNYEAQPQALNVFKKSREGKGSFKFLITPQTYEAKQEEDNDVSEYATIAKLIENIITGRQKEYSLVKEKIEAKEKAIAIVFDAKSKMLELKSYLNEHGIECKVSASENFYHTKEVSDIFHLLKAIEILGREKKQLSSTDDFYLMGAMRSNILRLSDNDVKKHLVDKTQPNKLLEYVELSRQLTLAELIKHIYDDARLIDVYAHLADVDQRVGNLFKFLELALEYETHNGDNLYSFVSLLEKAVYFSDVAEDEAFYKSDNVESIELCTIHSTKGLAYPMVILANSQKPVYSQIQSDSIKHNNFTLANGKQKEIVGFKVQGYEPLSLRVLKAVDKLKHLAEKKRLLYVALTRAEHDVVISARLDEKAKGGISLREDSYLHMMAQSISQSASQGAVDLEKMKKELFMQSGPFTYINELYDVEERQVVQSIQQVDYEFEPIVFAEKERLLSATQNDEDQPVNTKAASLGTTVHKLIELYWRSMKKGDYTKLLAKENIIDSEGQNRVFKALDGFLDSEVYQILKSGTKAYFELPFDNGKQHGYIDLVYFDEKKQGWVIVDFKTTALRGRNEEDVIIEHGYDKQLDFYAGFVESVMGEGSVVGKEICWLLK